MAAGENDLRQGLGFECLEAPSVGLPGCVKFVNRYYCTAVKLKQG